MLEQCLLREPVLDTDSDDEELTSFSFVGKRGRKVSAGGRHHMRLAF